MSEVKEAEAIVSSTNVTLSTTDETVVATSPGVPAPTRTNRFLVMAWAQLVTGANTSAVTPRIRRGDAVSGQLVNEANPETIKAPAASTEVFFSMALDSQENIDEAQYSLTLEQTGATANGTCVQSGIAVLVL